MIYTFPHIIHFFVIFIVLQLYLWNKTLEFDLSQTVRKTWGKTSSHLLILSLVFGFQNTHTFPLLSLPTNVTLVKTILFAYKGYYHGYLNCSHINMFSIFPLFNFSPESSKTYISKFHICFSIPLLKICQRFDTELRMKSNIFRIAYTKALLSLTSASFPSLILYNSFF